MYMSPEHDMPRAEAEAHRQRARALARRAARDVWTGDELLRQHGRGSLGLALLCWEDAGRLYAEALAHLDRREECLRRARAK